MRKENNHNEFGIIANLLRCPTLALKRVKIFSDPDDVLLHGRQLKSVFVGISKIHVLT